MFNALKYTQDLEKAGFTQDQAKASLNLLIEVMNENFATKSDLKGEIALLRSEIKMFEVKMHAGFKDVEYRLVTKLGSMMVVLFTLATAAIKLLPSH